MKLENLYIDLDDCTPFNDQVLRSDNTVAVTAGQNFDITGISVAFKAGSYGLPGYLKVFYKDYAGLDKNCNSVL